MLSSSRAVRGPPLPVFRAVKSDYYSWSDGLNHDDSSFFTKFTNKFTVAVTFSFMQKIFSEMFIFVDFTNTNIASPGKGCKVR